ncbi:mucin-2-like [Bolinopsis microptera]|uniref:mucin-2-like n=1 Tax=Bolinopsis microptera TaxID=2820187 RepID=UPI00307A8401
MKPDLPTTPRVPVSTDSSKEQPDITSVVPFRSESIGSVTTTVINPPVLPTEEVNTEDPSDKSNESSTEDEATTGTPDPDVDNVHGTTPKPIDTRTEDGSTASQGPSLPTTLSPRSKKPSTSADDQSVSKSTTDESKDNGDVSEGPPSVKPPKDSVSDEQSSEDDATTGTPDPDADNVHGTTPKPIDTRTKDKSTASQGPPLPTTLSPRSKNPSTSADGQSVAESTTDGSKDNGDISEGPPSVKPTKDSVSDEDEATTGTPDPDADNVHGTTPKPIDTRTEDGSTASQGPPLPTTLSPKSENPSTSADDQSDTESTTDGSKDNGDVSEGPPSVKPTKDAVSDEQSSVDGATTGTPDPDADNVHGTTPKPIDTRTRDKSTVSEGPPLPTTLSPRSKNSSTSADDQSVKEFTTDESKDNGDVSEAPPSVKPTQVSVSDEQSESPDEDTTTRLVTPPVDVTASYESSSADFKFKTSPPDTKSPQEFKTKTSSNSFVSEEPSEKPSDKINESSTDNGIGNGTEPIVSEASTLTPPTPSIPFSSTPPTVIPTEDTKTSSSKDVLTTSKVKVLPTTPNEKDSSDEMTGSTSGTTRGISTVTPTEDSGTVDKFTGDNRPTKETTTNSLPSYVSSEGIETGDNLSSTPPLPETSPQKSSEALTDSSLTESVTEKLKSSVSPTMDGKEEEDRTTKDSDPPQKTDPTKRKEKTSTPVTIVETFTNSPTTVSPKKDSVSDDESDLSEGPPTVTPTKGSVTDGQRSEDVVSTKLSTPPVDVSTSYETSSADMRFKTSPPDTKSPQKSKSKSPPKSSVEPSEKASEKINEQSTDDGNDETEPIESKPSTLTTVTPSIPISSSPPTVIPTKDPNDATTGTPDPDVDNVHGTTPKSTDAPSTKRGKNTSANLDDKTKTDGEVTTFSPGPSEDATEGTTDEIGTTEKAEINFCEKDKEYKSRVEEFCNELVFSIFMLNVDCRDTIGTTEFYRNCTEKLCKGDTPEQRCGLAFEYQASCTDGDIGSVQVELGIDCENMRPSVPFSAFPSNAVSSEAPTDASDKSTTSKDPSGEAKSVSKLDPINRTTEKEPDLPTTPRVPVSTDSSKEKPDITGFVPFRSESIGSVTPTLITPPVLPTTKDPSDESNEASTKDSTYTTGTPDPDADNVYGTTSKPIDTRTRDGSTASKGPPLPTTLAPKSEKLTTTAVHQPVKVSTLDGSKDKSDISEGPPSVTPTKISVSDGQSKSSGEDTTTKLATPPVDVSTSSADFKFKTSSSDTKSPQEHKTKKPVSEEPSEKPSDNNNKPTNNGISDGTEPIASEASTLTPPTPSIPFSTIPPTVVPTEDTKTTSKVDILPTTPDEKDSSTNEVSTEDPSDKSNESDNKSTFSKGPPIPTTPSPESERPSRGSSTITPTENASFKTDDGISTKSRPSEEIPSEEVTVTPDPDADNVQDEATTGTPDPDADNVHGTTPKPIDTRTRDKSTASQGPPLPTTLSPRSKNPSTSADNQSVTESTTDGSKDNGDVSEGPPSVKPTKDSVSDEQSSEEEATTGTPDPDADNVYGTTPIPTDTRTKDKSTASQGPPLPTTLSPRSKNPSTSADDQSVTESTTDGSKDNGDISDGPPTVKPTKDSVSDEQSSEDEATTGMQDPDVDNVEGTTPKPSDTRTKDKSTASKGPPLPTTLSPRSKNPSTSADDQSVTESTTDGSKDNDDVSEGPPSLKPTKDSVSDEHRSEDEVTTGTPDPDVDNVEGTTPKPTDTRARDGSTVSPKSEKPFTSPKESVKESTMDGSKDNGDVSEVPPSVKQTKDSVSDGDKATTGTPDPDADNVHGTTPKPIDTRTKDKSTASQGPPLPTTLSTRSKNPSTSAKDQSVTESTTDGFKDNGDVSEGPPSVKPTKDSVSDEQSSEEEATTGTPDPDADNVHGTTPIPIDTRTKDKSTASQGPPLPTTLSPQSGKSSRGFSSITPTKGTGFEVSTEHPSDETDESSTEGSTDVETNPPSIDATVTTPTPDPNADNVHGTTSKPTDTRTRDGSPKSEKPSTSAEESVKESTTDGSQDKSDISEGPPTVVPTKDSVSDGHSSEDEVTTGTPDPDADNVHEVPSEVPSVETVTPKPSESPKCVLLSFNKAQEAFSQFFGTDDSAAFKRCQEVPALSFR